MSKFQLFLLLDSFKNGFFFLILDNFFLKKFYNKLDIIVMGTITGAPL